MKATNSAGASDYAVVISVLAPCSAPCSPPAIHSILVTSTYSGGGGGGPFRYGHVDARGTVLADVSPSAGVALYQTGMTPTTLIMTSDIQRGWFFAVLGGEGSGSATYTFTLRDAVGGAIDTVQVVAASTDIVRSGGNDLFTRFYFDGATVKTSQQTSSAAIHSITVTTTYSGGGGGGPFRYARVSADGTVLVDVSGAAGVALYQTGSMPATLTMTTDIQGGWYFAVVGGEGSSSATYTFTFKDAGGTTLTTLQVVAASTDIVRSGPADLYTRFLFDGTGVTSSPQTSQ